MFIEWIQRSSKSGGESTDDSGSGQNTFSYNNNQHKAEFQLEPESPMSSKKSSNQFLDHQKQLVEMESDLHQNHHNTSGSTRLAAAAGGGTGLVQNQQQPKALEKVSPFLFFLSNNYHRKVGFYI